MEYRRLGRSGVGVSALGLGCNQLGGAVDQRMADAIVGAALEQGVTFFDTAESYNAGRSEELLGKALGARRSEVLVATKTGAPGDSEPGSLSRRRLVQRLEGSLRRLGTDHVDLYYLHYPDSATPLDETLRALDDLVRSGKVRYPAVSNHPAWQVAELVGLAEQHGWSRPVANQVRYNLFDRSAEAETVPACRHFDVSLIPYAPLFGGFLTGKYRPGVAPDPSTRFGRSKPGRSAAVLQDPGAFERLERLERFAAERGHSVRDLAIAWLLAQPVVGSVIAGATRPEQVKANAGAVTWRLTADDLAELTEAAVPG